MTHERILEVITSNVLKILPGVSAQMVAPEKQLKDLGANSVDRMDIVMGAMEDLCIQVPLAELGEAKNIGTLIDVFARHYA